MNEEVSVEKVTVARVEEAMFIFVLNRQTGDGRDRVKAAEILLRRLAQRPSKEKVKHIENALLSLVTESGNGQVESAELLLKRIDPPRMSVGSTV